MCVFFVFDFQFYGLCALQSGEQMFRTDELQDIDELYVIEVSTIAAMVGSETIADGQPPQLSAMPSC